MFFHLQQLSYDVVTNNNYEQISYSYYNAIVGTAARCTAYSEMMNYPPPPPYRQVQSEGPKRPYYPYQQQYHSTPSVQLPTAQSNTLRKKRSAWMSSRDLSRPNERPQEQGSKSTPNVARLPQNEKTDGCPVDRRTAAWVDDVAQDLQQLLCRIDESGQGADVLEFLTRDLSLQDEQHNFPSTLQVQSEATRKAREQLKLSRWHISKVWLYQNARLPPHVPHYRPYLATWRLFCRAVEAANSVYERKRGQPNKWEEYVDADRQQGTKAMTLKSEVHDHDKLIVISIRGSQWKRVDWHVNFKATPENPVGFLDDETNACHAGFLQVARSMIQPVASHLRQLIEQDPSRAGSSLLFTGHSAGGAVANLLYLHMLSEIVSSELTAFNGVFRRIHCVTFGVPPISLLSLHNPPRYHQQKYQFVSFINEGDPVVRADAEYFKSLLKLYMKCAPDPRAPSRSHSLRQTASRQALKTDKTTSTRIPDRWYAPDAALSNAGRLVLLREKPGQRTTIEAVVTSDEQLRGVKDGVPVIFGDPAMHAITVYERRIQNLAIESVTGKSVG